QALGHQACISGIKTLYAVTARHFKKLKLSKIDGTYLKELEKLAKTELLILDDFGLQAFDNQDRETLMDNPDHADPFRKAGISDVQERLQLVFACQSGRC